MTELQDALDRRERGDWSYADWGRIMDAARKCANPDYEAAAKSRWDARFGDGTWDEHHGTQLGKYTRESFLNSAIRDVNAALGISNTI